MSRVIEVDEVSKFYRLGVFGRDTLRDDVQAWLRRALRRPEPVSHSWRDRVRGQHVWALREVSFAVDQGEIVGIVGGNGAGKSTLLKILSRITAPTSGAVRLKGRVGSLLEVGTGFHPELTGRENIFLNGAILGMTREETQRKYDVIVEFSGIGPFIDTPVKRFSSGMRVRLAFAVAAYLEPEILLVDEVLAVGDIAFQKRCIGKMGDVAKGGRTVLFVSHDMSAISALCERVILLEEGRLVADGETDATIKRYVAGMNGAGPESGEIRLTPEGHDDGKPVALHAVRTRDADGRVRGDFRSAESIVVELEFTRFEPIEYLRIGFDVVSSRGMVVFRTFHNDLAETLPGGRIGEPERLQAILPAGLLNGDVYQIRPCVRRHRRGLDWILRDVAGPSFNVMLNVPNPDYADSRRAGLVAPMIEWRTG
ncbi:MAG TPA: polysaccharide ABC transporter ATP-binding protein [Longimicrobiales bacterium]|nr:polysaccharide ABC transporter ATP-binding protein [Longimicrobiales bacterium]